MENLTYNKKLKMMFIIAFTFIAMVAGICMSHFSFSGVKLEKNTAKAASYSFSGGSGTKDEPWLLSTYSDLQTFESLAQSEYSSSGGDSYSSSWEYMKDYYLLRKANIDFWL